MREKRLAETLRKADGRVLGPGALSQNVSGAKRGSKNKLNPTMIATILFNRIRFWMIYIMFPE